MAIFNVGYKTFSFRDEDRNRPVLIDMWYPASPDSKADRVDYNPGYGIVAKDASHINSPVPVILLSHGAFGAARNYTWITEYLAGSGYLVVGISHYGESFIYGPDTIDPVSVLNPELRTEDCSFILNSLVFEGELAGFADTSRIGALGHSSGGATALELGGAVFDMNAMIQYCASGASGQDKGCNYAHQLNAGPLPVKSFSGRDDRIRALVALDPALGPGHTSDSLENIQLPVYIAGAVHNDFLPYKYHAGRYARLIPGTVHKKLNNGEGHFIFLNESGSMAESNGVPLYRDKEGVVRGDVHIMLRKEILDFFDYHLKS